MEFNREINQKIKKLEVYQENTNNNNLVHIIEILKRYYRNDSKLLNFCKISINHLKKCNGRLDIEEFKLITKNLDSYLKSQQTHKKLEAEMLIRNVMIQNERNYNQVRTEILRIKKERNEFLRKVKPELNKKYNMF